jgi:hypothetical protein
VIGGKLLENDFLARNLDRTKILILNREITVELINTRRRTHEPIYPF